MQSKIEFQLLFAVFFLHLNCQRDFVIFIKKFFLYGPTEYLFHCESDTNELQIDTNAHGTTVGGSVEAKKTSKST